jgi:hypothetical protein
VTHRARDKNLADIGFRPDNEDRQAVLGVVMLDTHFPRPPGDIGNPASFAFPVRYAIVSGAAPRRIVAARPDDALLGAFVAAARRLVADGAAAISTSCGFLVHWQREMQAALPVPVWTSALLLLPALERPGVLTVDAAALGPAHLRAAGADAATPVEGLAPGCALQRVLLGEQQALHPQAAEADTVAAARRLVARHPEVRTIVLECTNLPPYADAVTRATGRPVQHIVSMLHERMATIGATT